MIKMVNLKINVLKPHHVTSSDVYHKKAEDTIIHEQILRVPDSEKLKVLISTDTEIDKVEVFVKNKKDDANAFNSYAGGAAIQCNPNSFTNLNKPNEMRASKSHFEEDEDMIPDVESLTDDDLRWWLKYCNAQVGPIVDSTRKMYISKLVSLLQERKSQKLVSQNSENVQNTNESTNIARLSGREIHTISKRKYIQSDCDCDIQKQDRMEDQNARVIHTVTKLKHIQDGSDCKILNQDGMIKKTFLSLLSGFVTFVKLILFAVSGMVAYYLVFESE